MLVSGLLLFISLFLPWQDFDVGGLADEFGVDATFSGWRGIGVIVGILAIALVAWLIVRLASVDMRLPVSTAMVAAVLGALILLFTVIKLLTIIDDEATIWAWIGLLLAVAVAVGAFMTVQEAGGIDQLRSEVPARSSQAQTAPPAAPAEPYSPPPPAAPERTMPEPEATDAPEPPGDERRDT
jgi:hypothetical protein